MTIKEFAALCGCNTQTLRYYDKIDLLKPVKVDPWSGYRYYESIQAIAFVKIKNLQAADFTIDQIKKLLEMSDQQLYDAFEQKIVEQAEKLERIKKIQQSYLTEKNNMEKLVHNLSDFVLHAVTDSGILREFCLNPEDAPAITENLKAYIAATSLRHSSSEPDVALVLNNQVFRGIDHVADAIKFLKGTGHTDTVLLGDEETQEEDGFTQTNSETIWECHGWKFVYEFIDSIPKMDKGYDYCFFFKLAEDKYTDGFEFPMLMISTMLTRTTGEDIIMGCSVERSPDGQNHFALARRKERR